jgi:hypothetical protein
MLAAVAKTREIRLTILLYDDLTPKRGMIAATRKTAKLNENRVSSMEGLL